jgi:RyR domain
MPVEIKNGSFWPGYACGNRHVHEYGGICQICGGTLRKCVMRAKLVPRVDPNFWQKMFDPFELVWEFHRWLLRTEGNMDELIQSRAARAAHEANRVLCLALGDNFQPMWEDAPDWQQASALKGVQMIYDNPATTPEQSHEGWLAEKQRAGWKYGPVKNPDTKEHPCCVPYGDLSASQRLKDEMFGLVVRAVLGV